jgi:hypothetical protein
VVLSLPQFVVAPFVIAETDLVATLASRVARRFAATGVGIAVHEPPIELPYWPLAMMWHRRAHAHAPPSGCATSSPRSPPRLEVINASDIAISDLAISIRSIDLLSSASSKATR